VYFSCTSSISRLKRVAILTRLPHDHEMTKPLTLLSYEKLLPGSQLVNRLEDRGYRVQVVSEPGKLIQASESAKPLLVIVDLEPHHKAICDVVAQIKQNAATSHIPVIAICRTQNLEAQNEARAAGATLVVTDSAVLVHLDQFLDQALEV
jgi:CheY-like chemotaxis protein